ncbi:MAG TPA: hypothetical protein VHI13_16815 [Candidatus Kapabacteria bacterium]|nr:hypothetical protein [Candidatus Kapabacteria bacterium]
MTTLRPIKLDTMAIAIICLLLGTACGWLVRFMVMPHARPEITSARSAVTAVVHDTTIQIVESRRLVYRHLPARVTRLHDTLVTYIDSGLGHHDTLVAQPFRIASDTVSHGDTVSVTTTFPPPLQTVVWRRAPDTLHVPRETITVTTEVVRERPWYESIGIFLAGAGLGYLTRTLTHPDRP